TCPVSPPPSSATLLSFIPRTPPLSTLFPYTTLFRSPLMTLYLTDHTSADQIRRARESGFVHGVKLYPAGATTNSDAGVTDLLGRDRKSTRLNSSHVKISYAVFCLKKKNRLNKTATQQ